VQRSEKGADFLHVQKIIFDWRGERKKLKENWAKKVGYQIFSERRYYEKKEIVDHNSISIFFNSNYIYGRVCRA
jgi:hypothetical protein